MNTLARKTAQNHLVHGFKILLVSKHFLASAITWGFSVCKWDGSYTLRIKVMWEDGGVCWQEMLVGDSQGGTSEKHLQPLPQSVCKDAWLSFVENRMDQAGRWLRPGCPLWFSECSEVRPLWPHRVKPCPSNSRVFRLRTTQSPVKRAGIHSEYMCLPMFGLFSWNGHYLKFITWVTHSVWGISSLGS